MKTFLKFSGLISLVAAVVGFVLMLATQAIVITSGNTTYFFTGPDVMFGCTKSALGGLLAATYKAAPLALISFILVVVALLVLLAGFVLPLAKVKALERFAGVLNLCALVCLVLAGIFMFSVVPNFFAANELNVPNNTTVGAGWVIGGIIYIAAGAVAICPACADFFGKNKKK